MAVEDYKHYPEQRRALASGTKASLASSAKVFKDLDIRVQNIIDEKLEERANKMKWVLSHRIAFGSGVGRYPKFSGYQGKESHNPSYRQWTVERQGKTILLYNDARGFDGFSYPLLLAYGQGSAKSKRAKWNFAPPSAKVNSKGFSTQMPEGIAPLITNQRKLLLADIKQEVLTKLGKKF